MSEKNSTQFSLEHSSALLGPLFVGLKLCGVIDWSWWYVLLPFYLPILIIWGLLLIAVVFSLIHEMTTSK
jgi:fatty acid desaturase